MLGQGIMGRIPDRTKKEIRCYLDRNGMFVVSLVLMPKLPPEKLNVFERRTICFAYILYMSVALYAALVSLLSPLFLQPEFDAGPWSTRAIVRPGFNLGPGRAVEEYVTIDFLACTISILLCGVLITMISQAFGFRDGALARLAVRLCVFVQILLIQTQHRDVVQIDHFHVGDLVFQTRGLCWPLWLAFLITGALTHRVMRSAFRRFS